MEGGVHHQQGTIQANGYCYGAAPTKGQRSLVEMIKGDLVQSEEAEGGVATQA